MPTTYKRGKKKATAKKKPTKRPAKKGSKGGSKSGGGTSGGEGISGGSDVFGPQDPIVISGGGSVRMKFRPSQFKDHGSGNWKNDDANLSSLSIDGGTPIPLSPTSEITIKLS